MQCACLVHLNSQKSLSSSPEAEPVEARDLNEAAHFAAEVPRATLGAVEVLPLVDFSQPRPSF